MTEDPIGTALRELAPEPPRELSMAALTAARTRARRRHGLVAAGAVAAAVAVAVPAGLALRPAAGPDPVASAAGTDLVGTEIDDLLVTHPAAWRPQSIGATMTLPADWLSTATVTVGCPTGAELPVCAYPVARLGPDGVLVSVERQEVPTTVFDTMRRVSGDLGLRIGGRDARTEDGPADAGCRENGGVRSVSVMVRLGAYADHDDLAFLRGCLAGPDPERSFTQLTALAATLEPA